MPRANILADCRYSPIACAQVEGRCHRDGQHATVYYAYADKERDVRVVGPTFLPDPAGAIDLRAPDRTAVQ